jgi:ceramide glucosyltransferase
LALLAWGIVNRMLLAAVVGAAVVQERSLLRTILLYPLRDLMGFGFWLASYGSSTILWRGELYQLEKGGYMRSAQILPVAVDGEAEQESPLIV